MKRSAASYQPRNPALYQAIREYTVLVLGMLRQQTPQPWPRTWPDATLWEYQGSDMYIQRPRADPDWTPVFTNLYESLSQLQEYARCVDCLLSDKVTAKQCDVLYGSYWTRFRLTKDRIVNNIVSSMLRKNVKPTFHWKQYDYYYSRLEDELYSHSITIVRTTPLAGVKGSISGIILDSCISIHKLRPADIVRLLNRGMLLGDGTREFTSNVPQYAIRIEYKVPKILGEGEPPPVPENIKRYADPNIIDDVLQVLRTWKSGEFYPCRSMRESTTTFVSGWSYSRFDGQYAIRSPYTVTARDRKKLPVYWELLHSRGVKGKRFLLVALRRLSIAPTRQNPEDKLIDLAIASEALFMRTSDDDRGEYGFKMAIRAAHFVAKNRTQRQYIFDLFKNFYSSRSQIVHGNGKKLRLPNRANGQKYTTEELCSEIEGYLRTVLHKMLSLTQLPNTPRNLIDWDDIIFT